MILDIRPHDAPHLDLPDQLVAELCAFGISSGLEFNQVIVAILEAYLEKFTALPHAEQQRVFAALALTVKE